MVRGYQVYLGVRYGAKVQHSVSAHRVKLIIPSGGELKRYSKNWNLHPISIAKFCVLCKSKGGKLSQMNIHDIRYDIVHSSHIAAIATWDRSVCPSIVVIVVFACQRSRFFVMDTMQYNTIPSS